MPTTTATPAATHILAPVLERLDTLDNSRATHLGDEIRAALSSPARGTMRAWLEARHGATVDTVQACHYGSSTWAPLDRVIDATRAGSVRFNGSTRDYAGMKVQHVTDTTLIVANDEQTIAYVISPA